MKLIIIFSFVLSACDLFKKKSQVSDKIDRDKGSYAIGLQIGENFKQQGLEIEYKSFSEGVRDALEGKKKYTKEEIQANLLDMQKDMVVKTQEKASENQKESLKFLEENKKRPGVKTTKSGLQYEVLKEGSGKTPSKDSKIKVHYVGSLANGQEFDNSVARKAPLEIKLSQSMMGWQEGLLLFKSGSKVKLYIPPSLGYGPNARPGIPANSVLIYEIDLLEVH